MTPEDLLSFFAGHNLDVTVHHHEPIFTVEEGQKIKNELPGAHTKNLFLKDSKTGRFLLVSMADDAQLDLKVFAKDHGCKRLSFGSAELMKKHLKVTPGSVTPFAIINDHEAKIELIIDKNIVAYDLVNFHPLINTMTVTMRTESFLRFFRVLERKATIEHLPYQAE
jgi:Ala-tRNA(Pro) deacylase